MTKTVEELVSNMSSGGIAGVLRCMAVAGAELDARLATAPAWEAKRSDVHMLLRPTGGLSTMALEMYRAHVREILDRVDAGQDTRPGTAAECLAGLSTVSLEVMPNREIRAAIDLAWRLVFDKPAPGEPFLEEWPGQADETLAEFRKKMAVADRTLTPKPKKKDAKKKGGKKA